jgi:hypothetical protein
VAETPLEKEAKKAATYYTRRGLVLVALRDARGDIVGHGSGTLFRAGGRTVVLTAKHVVTGHRSFSLMSPVDDRQERIRDADPVLHPRLDVALLPVADAALCERAFDLEAIADVRSVPKAAHVVLTGFPDHTSFIADDAHGPIRRFADMTHFGFAAGSDATAISVRWKDAEFADDLAPALQRFGMKPGLQPLSKPEGISGGGAWLWPAVPAGQLWAPTESIAFLGVPYQFTNGRQLVVPVWAWKSWLVEQLTLDVR